MLVKIVQLSHAQVTNTDLILKGLKKANITQACGKGERKMF
jgi:hypothetical protein